MKRTLIAVVCMLIGLQIAAGQGDNSQDKIELFRMGIMEESDDPRVGPLGNYLGDAIYVSGASPPSDGAIVYGYMPYDDPVFQSDAGWYFTDQPEHLTWTPLDHSQIQPLTNGVFEEAVAQAGVVWEEYLEDDGTLIKVSAGGSLLYVVDDFRLHLIDLTANVVIVMTYSNGMYCGTPDGKSVVEIEKSIVEIDQDGLPDVGVAILRCYHLFEFTSHSALLFSMKDPKSIQLGVLKALDSRRLEYEEMSASIKQRPDPPVIWLQGHSKYIKWDGAYDIGASRLGGIAVEGHLVRHTVLTHDYPELLEGRPSPRIVRVMLMLNALEQILSGNGKWLRKVQRHRREHILIRNLSNMYK